MHWAVAALLAVTACSTHAVPPLEQPASVSWMARGASSAAKLLYVTDLTTFDVDVYAFPSLAHVGKLTGFKEPQGECTDSAGDVWIASALNQQIVQYAHGASSPIAKLSDPVGYPVGCAVDPASGDLAVTNHDNFSGAASVLVYRHARGTPVSYSNAVQYYDAFAAYDAAGDLYVSGASAKNAYALAVLRHGQRSMSILRVTGGKLYVPGTVELRNATLVLGDQRCGNRAASCLYEASVSGDTATIRRTTHLLGACDVAQAWVGDGEVAGGAYACDYRRSTVALWAYPSGGKPQAQAGGVRHPVAAVLSVSSKKIDRRGGFRER